jgi:hypothetical protein
MPDFFKDDVANNVVIKPILYSDLLKRNEINDFTWIVIHNEESTNLLRNLFHSRHTQEVVCISNLC